MSRFHVVLSCATPQLAHMLPNVGRAARPPLESVQDTSAPRLHVEMSTLRVRALQIAAKKMKARILGACEEPAAERPAVRASPVSASAE